MSERVPVFAALDLTRTTIPIRSRLPPRLHETDEFGGVLEGRRSDYPATPFSPKASTLRRSPGLMKTTIDQVNNIPLQACATGAPIQGVPMHQTPRIGNNASVTFLAAQP